MDYPLIASPANEKIKFLKKLARKRHRDEAGMFLVENLVIIYDAIRAGFKPVTVFVTEELEQSGDERVDYILHNSTEAYRMNNRVNQAFSTLATPSRIAAVFKQPAEKSPALNATAIYLNGIADPGNLGTILRTALAFGIETVVVDEFCADIYNPKTIQAAKESVFKLAICEDKELKIFKRIKETMPVYAADMNGAPIHTSNIMDHTSLCIVFGSEAEGIDAPILEQAGEKIAIPMAGDIESLNVAVSAGIILYALTRPAA